MNVGYWGYFGKDKYDLGAYIDDSRDQSLDGTHTDTKAEAGRQEWRSLRKPLISRRVKVASRKHLHKGWALFGAGVNRQGGREESLYWKKARRAQHSQRVKRLNFLWVAASSLEWRNFNFAPYPYPLAPLQHPPWPRVSDRPIPFLLHSPQEFSNIRLWYPHG